MSRCVDAIRREGCDVLLSIRAYLNTGPAFQISPIAAQSPSPSVLKNGTNLKSKSAAPSKKTVFNDAQETDTEKQLRERKTSLNRMFDQVSLYPTRSNSLLESHKAGGALDSKRSLLEHYDGAAERKLKKEMEAKKVKDEGANDDAEDMSEDQVNSVYSKAVRNDINLPEMEPSPSFKLDLRPYQKQALK
jgi:DNA repair protein RAD5